jgi:hypothetical protein
MTLSLEEHYKRLVVSTLTLASFNFYLIYMNSVPCKALTPLSPSGLSQHGRLKKVYFNIQFPAGRCRRFIAFLITRQFRHGLKKFLVMSVDETETKKYGKSSMSGE